jgi:hypothetical protein
MRGMELDFAVIADGAQHRADGKLDVYGAGFDTILAPSVPAQHPRIVVALRVLISREEARGVHTADVILRPVGGEPVARAHAELAPIPGAETIPVDRLAGIGMILAFNNVVFPEFGTYEFAIQWNGEDMRNPIRLFVAEAPVQES